MSQRDEGGGAHVLGLRSIGRKARQYVRAQRRAAAIELLDRLDPPDVCGASLDRGDEILVADALGKGLFIEHDRSSLSRPPAPGSARASSPPARLSAERS